jgi:outer membrane receptor protein involved in Fe transport
MSIKPYTLALIAGLVVAVLAPERAAAQGKIAGTVTDAETGDPLIGVNVRVEDTQRGTATNANGDYAVVNIRPGTYTVKFSYVGFGTKLVEGVQVATGRTSRVNVEMSTKAVEGKQVTVQAERPLVRKDLTASRQTVTADQIEEMPVESFFGVLKTQAGVTQGANGAMHIRGGRSNEISYLVDGMSVANPFETNGLATGVAKDAIKEMTVISGAFNAEYGKAMSGIVNLVTKEGSDEYEGSFSAYGGDELTTHGDLYNTPSGVNLNEYTFEGTFSGPVPLVGEGDDLTFFLSGRRSVDNGSIYGFRQHLPSDAADFNVDNDEQERRIAQIHERFPGYSPDEHGEPWYYEFHGKPWWTYIDEDASQAQDELIFGDIPDERVAMNASSSYNAQGKLTWRPFSGGKITYSLLADGSRRQPFNFNYLYNPDGVADTRDWSYNNSLHWTHTLGDRTFYEVKASYAMSSHRDYLHEDPTDSSYVQDIGGGVGSGQVQGQPAFNFAFGGDQKTHIYEDSRSLRFKFDLTRQFGTVHEAKTGLEIQRHTLSRENFYVLYNERYTEPTVEKISTPSHDKYGCMDYISQYLEGEYKTEYENYLDGCEKQPVFEMSAYMQDKIEFDDFIINAGLRYERFDPNGKYIPSFLNPKGQLKEADPTNMLLPRLGVSFPITARGIIHFSYGHFAQMPKLRNMYRNPEFEFPVGSVPLFGNTNMRPERTVQYEVGLQQQIGEVLAFDVTGFYKDIRDYLARQQLRFCTIPGECQYSIYRNKDYANVKGLTVAFEKRRPEGGYLSADVNYTFQIAEGGNSDTFFYNDLSGRENEFVVIPLDFDQRHVLSTTVSVSQPGDWGASMIGRYTSGYPYTPELLNQNIDQLPNSERKPSKISLDLRLFKTFELGGVEWRGFAKIYNALGRLNENYVFDATGSGRYSLNKEKNVHAAYRPQYGLPGVQPLSEYDTRPHFFSSPRSVRLGLNLSF